MPTTSSAIEARVAAFVAELTALLHESALETVEAALSGEGSARSRDRAPRAPRAASGRRRTKGAKRDASELERLVETLFAAIRRTPGQRIEQIGKALGIATKELTLPVRKLLAAKRVSTKGQRRATAYYPAGAGRRGATTASKKRASATPNRKAKATRKSQQRTVKKARATAPAGPQSTPRETQASEPAAE